MEVFNPQELKQLYQPAFNSNGEDNGQVTIVGGSKLFHGAPILALKAASRIVDMVFFTSPEPGQNSVISSIKATLSSFIWVPFEEVAAYIEKSDAVLIGPGLMRYSKETVNINDGDCDQECVKTREVTRQLLKKFPQKKWVIDAGSLQTMDEQWIPKNAIITPNVKEFEMLFKIKGGNTDPRVLQQKAKEHDCVIVAKGVETLVVSPDGILLIKGGNPGLTKGGSGDLLAGLTLALAAKNDPFLAACSASYLEKYAADELYAKVGINYNMDDLADKIPETFQTLLKSK
ncbi:MAG: YjeF-like protein [Candidatus Woesebacteria bacterium GW2011_GWA1_39_21]|uniref:ADP-dependent (S)-NAD(P)H-hydrate dehydratase n=1 Tax=Candidatus Woesebacteria bacterium GW2011_GWA1_39_21 TaxID=1618550 RepID=A0A0G0RDW9_9BACT|nr:MAG: YjeF-like protein [Candidatus Woesebacteria bacterium GW2011_GWA1_39_21]